MRKVVFLGLILCILLSGSCAIDRYAVNKVADMLSAEGSTVFTGEDDPELIGEALPFALKLYESLLESTPEHTGLLMATGKAFCLYAFGYVQQPAEMLRDEELDEQQHMLGRAKKLYLRARGYLFRALELELPGFQASLEADTLPVFLKGAKVQHAPFLLWAASAWMAAFTTDPFDMEMMVSVPRAVCLLERVLELDEGLEMGSTHEMMISYYGALPASMGGSEEKARYHFEKALEYSQGKKASPYLNLAASVCVNNQDVEEFSALLLGVLGLDLDASPENRLVNRLAQKKAAWMLDNIEYWFLIDSQDDFGDLEFESEDDFTGDFGEGGF